MPTKVYGCSDDLIEFEGDLRGEVGFYARGEDEKCALILSDGTVLTIHYAERGIWKIDLIERGNLFDRLDICTDPEADPYSDVAHFNDGITRAWAAKSLENVR